MLDEEAMGGARTVIQEYLTILATCTNRMRSEVDAIRCLAVADPIEHDIAALDEVAWTLNHWRQNHDGL